MIALLCAKHFLIFSALTLVVIDAIVVGMDMMIKKYRETNKGKKRLCLITSAVCPIKDPDEGTKEDQVNTIAMQMAAFGMRLENIVVRGSLSENASQGIMDENDHLLNLFAKKSKSKTVYVDSSTSLLGALRTRKISPVTIFRGDLELSPKMKIKVRFMFCYPSDLRFYNPWTMVLFYAFERDSSFLVACLLLINLLFLPSPNDMHCIKYLKFLGGV